MRIASRAGPLVPIWLFRVRGFTPRDPERWSTVLWASASSAGWALLLYLGGLAWAWSFGFDALFRATAVTAHLPAALALMVAGTYWGAITLDLKLRPALLCFSEKARTEVMATLGAWTGVRPAAVGIIATWLLAIAVMAHAAGVLFAGDSWIGAPEKEWFGETTVPKALLILIWATPTGAVVGTGIWGFLVLLAIIVRLGSDNLVEHPVFVVPRLREFVLYEQFIALAWSGYVLQAYVATFGERGPIAFWYVVSTTLLALAALVLPHVAFHLALRRLESRLSAEIRQDAEDALKRSDTSAVERVRILASIAVVPTYTWLYDLRLVLSFTVGPLASAALALSETGDPLIALLGCVLLGRCGG
ncbi:MAG: hypothetical protein HYU87_04935 [Chloroflexi bacterium]|nr:hypothetical protein [Chloroflexota bacterium]